MKLSIVIPAHNEEDCIEGTITELVNTLSSESISHEIVVVNDASTDKTREKVTHLIQSYPSVRLIDNVPPHGFGFAVRMGLDAYSGDAVALYMADASDSPADVVKFFREMEKTGADCVFGSRFTQGGKVIDYPAFKLILNRMANLFIQILFGLKYNDTTNAFKMYRRKAIDGIKPFLSHHFNLTVELPLKAIIRGFSYTVVPNTWTNRATGVSKLKIKEMGSRYLFIVLYCFIERLFSRGDYRLK